MPTGTPYNSFVLPYRIKVDDFATPSSQEIAPALHLLTHTHSDHINGLSAKSFGYFVVCSRDAKEMLLRHEVYAERELKERDMRAERVRTYAHLRVERTNHPMAYYQGSRDLLKPIHLHTPTAFELSNDERVVITAFDANHCPGAFMYLIEGSKGTILHTGDIRAEPWFLESLSRNPFLQPYLYSSANGPLHKPLDCIYLDTACAFSPLDIPSKQEATHGLIELMKLYPSDVYFYLNSWTWGYEDVLKAVATAFQTKVIHVDRYKDDIYQNVSDPCMRLILTRDPTSTRFHACERFHRCDHVWVDNEDEAYENAISRLGKRVVYVNPVTMGCMSWKLYIEETKQELAAGAAINNLLVPLSRHSTLPELRAFVSLFRPRRIVPNTLDPRLQGLDWFCIDRMFEGCLSDAATTDSRKLLPFQSNPLEDDEDVSIKNLVGCGNVAEIAHRWADSGNIRRKLEVAREYLKPAERVLVDRLLGKSNSSHHSPPSLVDKGKGRAALARRYGSDDDTDDDDDDDERGRTAHKLFASLAGIDENATSSWLSSPSSDREDQSASETLITPSRVLSSKPALGGKSVPNPQFMTPVSSPLRLPRRVPNPVVELATPSPTRRHQFSVKYDLTAGNSLASPICLLSSSPVQTIFSSPVATSKSKVPERYSLKSPLAEQKNRSSSTDHNDIWMTSPLPGPSSSHRKITSTKHPVIPAVVAQMTSIFSPEAGNHVVAPESPLVSKMTRSLSSRRSWRHQSTPRKTPRGERAHLYLQRIKIAEQLAKSRPEFVAPSYALRREKLLARYAKLEAKESYARAVAKMGDKMNVPVNAKVKANRECMTKPGSREPIVELRAEPTVLSFEVDDGDGGMDRNRSRDLADAVRDAIANVEWLCLSMTLVGPEVNNPTLDFA
ncbi:hypothetical protein NP233_g7295 [Leucocoprinus birnbaumii]|uniref:Protein artemis n=1 Tax=Leucocoprinus birnbaumii TaxID=56174 RepID=A0AAD5VPJ6_9AGAR|nr:hypothetical protein NP233_g7295 [Leucocoprinus birnbaumii]